MEFAQHAVEYSSTSVKKEAKVAMVTQTPDNWLTFSDWFYMVLLCFANVFHPIWDELNLIFFKWL